MRSLVHNLRNITPLWIRIKFGPYIGYVAYFFRVYLSSNKKYPKVLSIDDTIEKIKRENLSMVRFGDGELSLMENIDLGFQKKNSDLAKKLKSIIQSNNPGLLICVPGLFGKINHFKKHSFWFTIHHLFKHGATWKNLLSPNKVYGEAFITRPYLTYKNTNNVEKQFKNIFSIWENKDVILIEGRLSRLGVGNDMFSCVKTFGRILCPAENAYDKYEEIKNEVLKVSKDKMILISLGPTAKVLTYELFLAGYRVLDIGHIDMEYEMFLKQAQGLQKVRYKYFNEIQERNPEDCNDPAYTEQIIVHIR